MAAGATYEPIATTTVSGTSTNSITFSSISGSYTDLILVFNGARNAVGNSYLAIRFNSDSGTNYSWTTLFYNTTSTGSAKYSNSAWLYTDEGDPVTEVFNTKLLHIMNYSNSTTYKTVLSRASTNREVNAVVSLWRSTSAINTIRIDLQGGVTPPFAPGSTFTLYGIAAA